MTLSYTLRLVCLLTVVCGVVTAALQILLACGSRFVLRHLDGAAARRRERILYLTQIAPLLVAVLVASALCLPEYLLHEPTHETEPVGWLFLLLAAAVGLWFGLALLRGFRVVLRTLRFVTACRRSGRLVAHRGSEAPMLALDHANPPVGLIGFLRPLILISSDLLEAGGLGPGALEVALDHERSHAAHRDNWKLLTLSFLPRLRRLPALSDRWMRPWQEAADWAADEDAVRGDPARSFLLAEALVRAARSVRGSHAAVISTALTSADTELAARVDRLLRPRLASSSTQMPGPFGLAAVVLSAIGAAVIASPWIYDLSERLLHLGGF